MTTTTMAAPTRVAINKHPKLSKAKARLLLTHPFFATLLLRSPIIITEEVSTAATDGQSIYYNPTLLEESTVEEVMSDLAHEVCHDALFHSLRYGTRNHLLWNYACDYAINPMLEEQGFKAPKGGWLVDAKYKGWNAERIYNDLKRNPPPPQGGAGQGQPGGPSSPGSGPPGAPGVRLFGDVKPFKAATPAEQAKAELKAKQRVAAAATMAKMAGKLTGQLAMMVDEMLDPAVPWTDVLRRFMTKAVKHRDSWAKRNRRFQAVYLPTRHSRKMGPMVFIPDTSGSMFGEDMEKICSEMAHCAAQTQPENIRVVWTDAAVKGEQVFTPIEFDFKALKPLGGGGTDMRVGLKHVEQYEPQVVVLMTDGYTPWPTVPCPFTVICVCTTDQHVPEWMEVIRI